MKKIGILTSGGDCGGLNAAVRSIFFRAKKEFELYEDRFARLISVMIGIVDPEVIVFGGGMSNVGRLYDNIPKLLPKYTFSDKIRNKILRNTHGDSSGVRGAAWLWDSDKF